MYRALAKPLLFRLDPERAHHLALTGAALLAKSPTLASAVRKLARPADRPVTALGLTFPNRVGLAGGMDKDAVAPLAWWAFGFGFLELGTVTPRGQEGNPKPRMFRRVAEEALVNRLGFNNNGAAALAAALEDQRRRGRRPPCPVGVSVGKLKDTPPELAADDFAEAARLVAGAADFLTVNVSSPNTPGLRALQTAADTGRIVRAVRAAAPGLPVLVKLAPELVGDDLHAVLDAVTEAGAGGVIATNTLSTAGRAGYETGGLSGPPLHALALKSVEAVRRRLGDAALVVGCGGVRNAATYAAMRAAGADLVQLYTGLVYAGPLLPAGLSRVRSANHTC